MSGLVQIKEISPFDMFKGKHFIQSLYYLFLYPWIFTRLFQRIGARSVFFGAGIVTGLATIAAPHAANAGIVYFALIRIVQVLFYRDN